MGLQPNSFKGPFLKEFGLVSSLPFHAMVKKSAISYFLFVLMQYEKILMVRVCIRPEPLASCDMNSNQ